jgi:hypothetical protein
MSAYTFTVRATDANGKSGTRQYTINVINTANNPTFSLDGSVIVSNDEFFEKYQESIVGAPTFELPRSVVKSNDEFFIEYEEDLSSDFTFELPRSVVKSNDEFFIEYEEDLSSDFTFELLGTEVTGPIAEA